MKYLMGLGEYGIAELFGSTAVCALYVPVGCLPFIRKAYKDMIGETVDDYQAFAIVKDIFPNYAKNRYNLVDWFVTSHYYEVDANDSGTGTMNYMTSSPDFVVDSLNVILSCVYVPDVKYFNDLIEASGRSFGMASYLMVSQTEDLLLMEINDIYESMESKECGPPERANDLEDSSESHPVDQYVVNFLATTISRVAYLSQIQKLELQCHASLPRGVSKEANDFYLSRCVKMNPEEKKHLFKVSFMEEKGC